MVVEEIREALEADGETRVSDLHVWRVGRDQFACAASIVTHEPKEPTFYKSLLNIHEEIAHVTLEVNRCAIDTCLTCFAERLIFLSS